MRLELALSTLAVVACFTRPASADSATARPFALDVEAQSGWMHGKHSGGVTLGFTGRLRYRFLTGGISLQGATNIFGSTGSLSAVAGLSVPLGFLRWDALAEAGWNGYRGVGENFLSGDPGVSAALPFAGVRSSALFRIHQRRQGVGLWLGPSFQYARDLTMVSRTYEYLDQGGGWLFGDARDEWVTRTVTVGQSRYSFLLVLCATVPL
jgi:hypothetical protein